SIAVYGGIAAVIGGSLNRSARTAVIAAAAGFTVAIALSRIAIGYHTPIEVAIGLVVGIAALGVMIAVAARYRAEHLPLGWLVAGALVVFVLFHGTRWPAERAIHRLAWWFDLVRPWCG